MTTKLTLTMEDEVIKSAKEYAAKNGRSLSDLVEHYFKSLKLDDNISAHKFSPKVKKLKGIISLSDDFDYKKVLAEELTKKYLSI